MEEKDKETFQEAQSKFAMSLCIINLIPLMGATLYPIIRKSINEDKQMNFPENANSFNLVFYCGAVFALVCCIICKSHEQSRKKMLTSATLLSLIGWICMLCSPNYSALLLGRIITGVAMGIQYVAIYYYTIECMYQSKYKTTALMRERSDFCIGIALIAYVGEIMNWRLAILIVIWLHVNVFFLLVDIVETPYFLLLIKGERTAYSAFNRLVQVNNESATNYYNGIVLEVREAQERNINIRSTLDNSNLYIKIALNIIYGISEVLVYYYYMPQLAGYNKSLVVISNIIFMMCIRHLSDMKNDYDLNRCRNHFIVIFILLTIKFISNIYFSQNNLNYYINVWAMLIYFLLYTNGWLCGYHTLTDNNTPYYEMVVLIAPLLVCKFVAATFILLLYDPFKVEDYSSEYYGLIEIVYIIFISRFSFGFQ